MIAKILLIIVAVSFSGCAVTYTREFGQGDKPAARKLEAGFRPTYKDYKAISRFF